MRDDVELLKECDSGVKMGIQSIDDVMDKAYGEDFKNMLNKYRGEHSKILREIHEKLDARGASDKEPNMFATANSKISTGMKLMMNDTDEKIADIMMDGCNMGIKSVSRYMNEYAGASTEVMNVANNVVVLEQNFMNDLRQFL
ncbi:MAG: hypothetical protein IJX99_04920 [Clostridia bacterium]|nr:hypothetical protein [Clostridia bacterium]